MTSRIDDDYLQSLIEEYGSRPLILDITVFHGESGVQQVYKCLGAAEENGPKIADMTPIILAFFDASSKHLNFRVDDYKYCGVGGPSVAECMAKKQTGPVFVPVMVELRNSQESRTRNNLKQREDLEDQQ